MIDRSPRNKSPVTNKQTNKTEKEKPKREKGDVSSLYRFPPLKKNPQRWPSPSPVNDKKVLLPKDGLESSQRKWFVNIIFIPLIIFLKTLSGNIFLSALKNFSRIELRENRLMQN